MTFNHVPVELTEMNAVTTEEGRRYRTPEGVDLPSITTVLSILSRDSIMKWRRRVGAALPELRRFEGGRDTCNSLGSVQCCRSSQGRGRH